MFPGKWRLDDSWNFCKMIGRVAVFHIVQDGPARVISTLKTRVLPGSTSSLRLSYFYPIDFLGGAVLCLAVIEPRKKEVGCGP